jgi:hypothetical protein
MFSLFLALLTHSSPTTTPSARGILLLTKLLSSSHLYVQCLTGNEPEILLLLVMSLLRLILKQTNWKFSSCNCNFPNHSKLLLLDPQSNHNDFKVFGIQYLRIELREYTN